MANFAHLTARNQDSQASIINFERNFNVELANDSEYFGALKKMTECVEKHANESLSDQEKDKVCAREYKALRTAAFNNRLYYHYVNKRFFVSELSNLRHEGQY